MQGLDLTPQKLKFGQQRSKRLSVWIAVVALVLLGNLIWVGYYYLMVHRQQSDLADLSLKQSEVQQIIEGLNQQSEQLSQWENRLFVLEELGRYPDYEYLTGFLAQHSPEMLMLTRLEFKVVEGQQTSRSPAPV